MEYEYDIFLSHNSSDKAWTEKLATDIESDQDGRPLKVFFDKWDIGPGQDIPAELEEGLQSSRYVGVVLTPDALSSEWVSLERSTAIYQDPSSRAQHLIPLLRKTCEIPDMLARLKYIDFREDQEYETGLRTLIALLRGQSPPRQSHIDTSDVQFREDANLLRQHRKIFDRPAFRIPCIHELSLYELKEAIDDTAAAINTGSLYSRKGNLLASFPDKNEYRLPEFQESFSYITEKLTELKREVLKFELYFEASDTEIPKRQDFYCFISSYIFDSDRGPVSKSDIKRIVKIMDNIDKIRNEIITEVNSLLERCGENKFDQIELSSNEIRKEKMHLELDYHFKDFSI